MRNYGTKETILHLGKNKTENLKRKNLRSRLKTDTEGKRPCLSCALIKHIGLIRAQDKLFYVPVLAQSFLANPGLAQVSMPSKESDT